MCDLTKSLLVPTMLLVLFSSFETVHGIECYRCISTNSTKPFLCNEFLLDEQLEYLEPENCDDVYDAGYCVKQVGRFEVQTIDCYQCSSADEWMCTRSSLIWTYLQPQNCSHVFEAQYCVKTVGRYGGGIGTKRFCSSANLGNYCDYVQQPGDKLSYRTCVYTCDSDGCNPASGLSPTKLLIILLTGLTSIFFLR